MVFRVSRDEKNTSMGENAKMCSSMFPGLVFIVLVIISIRYDNLQWTKVTAEI